jgi:hypothetical protein
VTQCFQSDVADSFLHGRLSDAQFSQALKHAAGCADCRRLLFATSQPDPELAADGMDEVQDRLTVWRAARRAPLMPTFPWHKGHEVDRYVITRSVGGTEDGVVYEAFDPEREERVVVKQLDLRASDPATPALMAAAHKQCQFSHPNVLQMLSVGVHAGFVYVVYEFVKGMTLSQLGAEDPQQVIALFAEAARGLAAAHDAGIVHGCFSAASCVVGRDGRVRVLDFGIGEARAQRAPAAKPHLEEDWTISNDQVASEDSFVGFVPSRRHPTSGQFESIVLAAAPSTLGPRIYAAPELVLGAPPSAAADQFAFCASLYHRLYGGPPYGGETIALWLRELLRGHAAKPPATPRVPAQVEAALLRGLERNPAARFDRMDSLIGKLARPRSRLATRTLAAVGAGIALAAAIVLVGGAVRGSSAKGAEGTDRRDASCDRSLAGWDGLWSENRQDALTRTTGAAAADAWPALRTRLDGWVGSWRAATHGFCSLPDDRAPALDCTSRAHAAATDLLQLVGSGAPSRVIRAAAAAEALPTFEQCESSAPSPAGAPIAAVKADLRRRLGMLDEADQLTATPGEDPAQRGYHSLVRGHTAADRGDLIEARRLFEAATFEAAAAHLPELGVSAAIERLALSCSAPERSLWSGYLAAQIQLASHPQTQTAYRGALAHSLLCEGKISEAIALRQQVAQALRGDTTAVGAAAAFDLARAQLAHGDLAAAETSAKEAATLYAQVYGPRHPQAQMARLTMAEAQLATPGTSVTAAATIERVLAEIGDHKEPDAVRGHALLLQGRLANARGNRADALRLVGRAAQESEAALGGAHPELASALLTAGDLLLVAGRDQEAETSYRQVTAIFDTLGYGDAANLAHARAGIQLARWGSAPPPDASDTLHWGLAPTGDAIDPAVAGWVAEQLGRRSAARGEHGAALAQYRAAAVAWQQSGDHRGLASALTEGALLAAEAHAPDAPAMLEQALQIGSAGAGSEVPRLRGALGKLLWSAQRDRARALVRSALADLPEGSADAADLRRWLKRHEADR